MPEGVDFPFPSLLFHEGRTYGQPEVVRISLPQVATGLRLRLPGRCGHILGLFYAVNPRLCLYSAGLI